MTSRKGISKIPGVSNVQVTTSGRPNVGSGAFSGGEIFGILFGVAAALVIANFAYKVDIFLIYFLIVLKVLKNELRNMIWVIIFHNYQVVQQ